MSADNRTVTTDALETLGSIITEREARDAIHIAVEPAVAACSLRAGEHVGFVDGGVGPCTSPVGIVDPFLHGPVRTGERFWLLVYPRQITSLRHVWSHPAFPEPRTSNVEASVKWLGEYATELGVSFDELVGHATRYVKYGEDWYNGTQFEGVDLKDEFWTHYEKYTHIEVLENDRGDFLAVDCCC